MKKILLVFFAFTTGTIMAQDGGATANASATVNAEIVSPISLKSVGDINFGRIAATETGGVVTIDSEGGREASSENMLIPGGTVSTAAFTVKAADGYSYSIALEAEQLTNKGGENGARTMDVTFSHDQTGPIAGDGKEQKIGLTSVLSVNPNQAAGEYTGEVTMTVAYE